MPAVLVQHKMLPDGTTQPDLTPCGQVVGDQKEVLRKLITQAKEDWLAVDHPNWSVRDMDSGQFLDSMQPGQVCPLHTSGQQSSLIRHCS